MPTPDVALDTNHRLGAAAPEPDGPAAALARSERWDARSHRAHERAALASAVDDGLTAREVRGILAGRRLGEAFPVRRGESPEAYAVRAVSEMLVAYLQ